jgi:hypothetical protein
MFRPAEGEQDVVPYTEHNTIYTITSPPSLTVPQKDNRTHAIYMGKTAKQYGYKGLKNNENSQKNFNRSFLS